jgi:hypothetical protein
MIELNFDKIDWKNLTDEEQSVICMAIVNLYDGLEKLLFDKFMDAYYRKQFNATVGVNMFHDWRRIRTNLRNYSKPCKLGEDLTILRWHTLYPLYHVCGFLEYINSLILTSE